MKVKRPRLSALTDKSGFRIKPRNAEDDAAVTYRIDGPLRNVDPYWHTYKTYCKKRWWGQELLEVFGSEFRDKSKAFYQATIEKGNVKVNGVVALAGWKLKDGDLITHTAHKHEPPVTSADPQIVFANDDIVVVNKPSGMPVHPTGRYRHNTVVGVLKHSHGLVCHPCNRLDRLTSGLMFLAKTPRGSKLMLDQFENRVLEKLYVARVKGNFPSGQQCVQQPLETYEPKLGLNRVSLCGKHAVTKFQKVCYDSASGTSLVLCTPLTGRTHQIRVHLQYLGYPIANDPIYSNPRVWGAGLGKSNAADYRQVVESLGKMGKEYASASWHSQQQGAQEPGEMLTGEKCKQCQSDLYSNPNVADLVIWLHAYKYQTKDHDSKEHAEVTADFDQWSFKAPLPEWAVLPHRKYMQLAIEQAKKCVPIASAYCVGAVIVDTDTDTVISTGYTRECPGNTHAEQNALSKYYEHHAELPQGSVIYTTMEPCSLRLSGNLPCADNIANTKGKIVACFVGVQEPAKFVKKNIGYQKLIENGIETFHIAGYEEEILDIATQGHTK